MKNFDWTALGRAPALVLVAVTLLFAAHGPARAQGGEAKDGPPRRTPNFSSLPRQPDPASIRERQSSMRSAETAAARKAAQPEQAKLALAQIGEDYRHIQVLNNQMLKSAVVSKGALDYKSISETTKEIGKRAARLKTNLVLPAPEGPTKRWAYGHARDGAQMKAALIRLDDLVMRFIMSPFFRNRDVVDARAGAKASGDLDEIIELCRLISEDASRLGKSPKAP
ncbi:MAG TPA: hypothetical protein VFS10_03245 [Pyrinomonadaceae bacterium]|nr:hypothetical protein [Pyrinomonadaceae bacterium]